MFLSTIKVSNFFHFFSFGKNLSVEFSLVIIGLLNTSIFSSCFWSKIKWLEVELFRQKVVLFLVQLIYPNLQKILPLQKFKKSA